MSLNYVHLHLLFNHFPTVGFGVGLRLFISALVRKNDEPTRANLVILFLSAGVTIATYVSATVHEPEEVPHAKQRYVNGSPVPLGSS